MMLTHHNTAPLVDVMKAMNLSLATQAGCRGEKTLF
jgi:hypothetical protein